MSSPLPFTKYRDEADVAVRAVLAACRLTKSVQSGLADVDTVTKPDKSPVTVADLSAQALISLHLRRRFSDPIIGEEDTTELRNNEILRKKVVGLVREGCEAEDEKWDGKRVWSEDEVLEAIDAGSAEGGRHGRFWAIDPVDGTSGFIRKQQYAVCLALLIDGQVELGLIGCPNIGATPAKLGEEIMPNGEGVLMIAVRGEGSYSRPLTEATYTRLHLPAAADPETLTFLESVEAGHSAQDIQKVIADSLGIKRPSLRMDSQAKYACLARGEGGVYLRIPTKYAGGKPYDEKIWDHASGSLLIEESGGVCTDMHGEKLDFGVGRTLSRNEGIVAAGKEVHPRAIEAARRAIAGR